jgi:hypothetical protein
MSYSETEIEMLNSSGLVGACFIVVVYGIPIFCIWKFYQMLSKINDNIAGIKRAIESNSTTPPIIPAE